MHEQAGRCSARALLAAAVAGSLALLVAGCGGGNGASTSTSTSTAPAAARTSTAGKTSSAGGSDASTAPVTAAERKMAAIITAWSVRLNRNDNLGVAELYSLPTLITQAPNTYRLTTRSEVALFFSLLPCAGKVVSVSYHGKFATAVFRLGNRGATPCDDPGALAAARFEIVKGKIVAWAQVAVPRSPGPTAQVA